MVTDTNEDSSPRSLHCSWPPDFSTHRTFHKPSENETYLQWLQRIFDYGDDDYMGESEDEDEGVEDETGMAEDGNGNDDRIDESNESGTIGNREDKEENAEDCDGYRNIVLFMKGMTFDDKALPYQDQAETIASFCKQALAELDPAAMNMNRKTVALIEDRSYEGYLCPKEGRCRPYLGPLTSQQFRKALGKNRFSVAKNVFGDQEVDAERRVIFITNLDAPTIEALIMTASRSQAPTLKNLFYKHLTSRASIGVEIPAHGYRSFSLDFHIPYYVLRKRSESFTDTRKKSDGAPLRNCYDFPFLSKASSTAVSSHCLYEAQTSVAVAGIDHWVWIAYGLFDTYFDSDESVDGYDQQNQSSWIPLLGRPDPLTTGEIDSNRPIRSPREYFLRVCQIRILKVLREWRLIIDKVEVEVQKSRGHVFPVSSNDPKIRQEVRNFSNWNRQLVKLLIQLLSRLSDTVEAWDEFQSQDIGYFLSGDSSTAEPALKPSVTAINKTFAQLKALSSKLERLRKELCEDNPQGVHGHLSLENNEAAIVQRRTARHVEILTVITIVFYPLALAASLFSTQGVLPFKPNFAYFMYALVILAALLVATLIFCLKWAVWARLVVNCLTMEFPFRKITTNDHERLDENHEFQASSEMASPGSSRSSAFRRGIREAEMSTPRRLEDGTEMDDLSQQ